MSDQPLLLELAAIAQKIEALARDADHKTLEAAALLAQTKARFDRFEIRAPVTWPQWSRDALSLGDTRIRELLRIGQAADPQAELDALRHARRERQTRHRAAKLEARTTQSAPTPADEPDLCPQRKRLIDFAKRAPLRQVILVLAVVDRFPPNLSDRIPTSVVRRSDVPLARTLAVERRCESPLLNPDNVRMPDLLRATPATRQRPP